MRDPIELDGWTISIRRGRRGGFVGHASHAATMRHLHTHEHTGKGAKQRATDDIMIQTRVDDILKEAAR